MEPFIVSIYSIFVGSHIENLLVVLLPQKKKNMLARRVAALLSCQVSDIFFREKAVLTCQGLYSIE
jgi:hypothetical protein